jgi:acetyl-CoA C-acetyltransferase
MSSFGRTPERTVIGLAEEAAHRALIHASAAPREIEALYLGTFAAASLGGQGFAASVLAARLGTVPAPAISVEGACASGTVALKQACNAIAAGELDVALVVGAEAMTARPTSLVTEVLARANDTAADSFKAGLTFPGFFGLVACSYLQVYGVDREALAGVAVKNRRHGASNPHAQFHHAVSHEEVLASKLIADPLRLLDCSAISDGAAALVVASPEWALSRTPRPIEVLACEHASGACAVEELKTLTSLPAAVSAAERAYRRAGVAPGDIDVAEVHDCFTIAEWIAIEDLGLVERGGAAVATASGETGLLGRTPVNPSGGLLSKGHPIGATGVAQVIEVVRQLRGEADNQVKNVDIGLTHNVGGTGGLASVSILARAA